jgi:hypothetical protein
MSPEKKSEYNRRYRATPEGLARATEARNRNKKLVRENALRYRMEHPCACGESDPAALDFHHKDPEQKYLHVGRMLSVGGWSWKTIKKEIAKCVVVCANCHRKGNAGRPRPEHAPYFPAALYPCANDTLRQDAQPREALPGILSPVGQGSMDVAKTEQNDSTAIL